MEKISAVYKIVNTVTGDCYVGSSKDVMHRWACHKIPSHWKKQPNSPMYKDMQKYGVDKFRFQILAPVMPEYLKQVEQELIEMLNPAYNSMNAKVDVERKKEHHKEWIRKYRKTEKGKEINRRQARKDMKKYHNQSCCYNGETLTLNTLSARFRKAGIEHPTLEAKKYLLAQQ
jgi:group I intron endonuclease